MEHQQDDLLMELLKTNNDAPSQDYANQDDLFIEWVRSMNDNNKSQQIGNGSERNGANEGKYFSIFR